LKSERFLGIVGIVFLVILFFIRSFKMTGYVEWENVAPKSSRGGEMLDFLRLKSGNTYRIRPLHKPVHFYKYFHRAEDGKLRTALTGDLSDSIVATNHPELKKPANRYAIFVIDRNDGNNIKIMEAPVTVFKHFRDRFEATGQKPGGNKDGGDWQIKITGSGLNTEYSVTYLKDTPLTQEELKSFSEVMAGDKERLGKIYKIDSQEEIEKKLFGPFDEEPVTEDVVTTETSSNDVSDEGTNEEDFDPDW
jgi:hypothetical protein